MDTLIINNYFLIAENITAIIIRKAPSTCNKVKLSFNIKKPKNILIAMVEEDIIVVFSAPIVDIDFKKNIYGNKKLNIPIDNNKKKFILFINK